MRPHLILVEGFRAATGRVANPRLAFFAIVAMGLVAIPLLNLVLNVATTQGVYQVASLKNQAKKLSLESQILGQQVDSLSSNQNLANAAKAMGMVSNANPVFLNVANAKVYGSPSVAASSSTSTVSGNLVANAELTTHTSPTAIKKAIAAEAAKATAKAVAVAKVATLKPAGSTKASAASGHVGGAKATNNSVGLAGGGIPVAVTH